MQGHIQLVPGPTFTTRDEAPLELPYSSVSTTPTVHTASVPAGTAATLIPVPAAMPTGRISCEPVTPACSVMAAPLVHPAVAAHVCKQAAAPQSVPTAGAAVTVTPAPGAMAVVVAALLRLGAAGSGGLPTCGVAGFELVDLILVRAAPARQSLDRPC